MSIHPQRVSILFIMLGNIASSTFFCQVVYSILYNMLYYATAVILHLLYPTRLIDFVAHLFQNLPSLSTQHHGPDQAQCNFHTGIYRHRISIPRHV